MSLAILNSRAYAGLKTPLVSVEVHVSNGLPRFDIVGLPETAVRESKDRVRSALLNTHFEFPSRRITVNLAPAELPKEGSRFDLAIALGILVATKQLAADFLDEYEFAGELALSGELKSVHAILPFALATKLAGKKLLIPTENIAEAALIKDLPIYSARHILQVCEHFTKHNSLQPFISHGLDAQFIYGIDFNEVKGQHHAKRALTIAAAGQHSALMVGPPGTGKTMLASRMNTILPAMSEDEALQTALVHSISREGFHSEQWGKRPYRSPHHTSSNVALVGGGNPPRPGEISRAHHGILFLDELAEFKRTSIESLREPLEAGAITISRASQQIELPAQFQLIAAMNPCPCGYLGHPKKECRCSAEQIMRYRNRLSGPLLDRIDLFITLQPVPIDLLIQSSNEMSSAEIKEKVMAARAKQLKRYGKTNAYLSHHELEAVCVLKEKEQEFLQNVLQKLHLSARAYHRVLKIARTIADLADRDELILQDLMEAVQFRRFDTSSLPG